MSDETMSVDEAAKILGVSKSTIYVMVKHNEIRGMKLASDQRKLLISRKDVEEMQKRNQRVIDHLTSDKD